jgi:hypothetical protein
VDRCADSQPWADKPDPSRRIRAVGRTLRPTHSRAARSRAAVHSRAAEIRTRAAGHNPGTGHSLRAAHSGAAGYTREEGCRRAAVRTRERGRRWVVRHSLVAVHWRAESRNRAAPTGDYLFLEGAMVDVGWGPEGMHPERTPRAGPRRRHSPNPPSFTSRPASAHSPSCPAGPRPGLQGSGSIPAFADLWRTGENRLLAGYYRQ